MNWALIGWVFGGLVTIYVIKFLFTFFSEVFGKEQRKAMIDKMGAGIHNASENAADSFKKKVAERKQKKEEEQKAIVYIR